MADAIILSRVASGPTTCECRVQFIGADLLQSPTYANVTATVDYANNNPTQLMAAFAAAVRTLSASIRNSTGAAGVTVPANGVILPTLGKG